ncbi:hypothetical protein ABOA88_10420, partial [Pseudomonas sp. PKS]
SMRPWRNRSKNVFSHSLDLKQPTMLFMVRKKRTVLKILCDRGDRLKRPHRYFVKTPTVMYHRNAQEGRTGSKASIELTQSGRWRLRPLRHLQFLFFCNLSETPR